MIRLGGSPSSAVRVEHGPGRFPVSVSGVVGQNRPRGFARCSARQVHDRYMYSAIGPIVLKFTGDATCDGEVWDLVRRTPGTHRNGSMVPVLGQRRDYGYRETVTARMRGREERASKDSDGKDEGGYRRKGEGRRGAAVSDGHGTKLVVAECPSKARTIAGYLGQGYVVESSVGHIRDMPDSAAEIPASTAASRGPGSASTWTTTSSRSSSCTATSGSRCPSSRACSRTRTTAARHG